MLQCNAFSTHVHRTESPVPKRFGTNTCVCIYIHSQTKNYSDVFDIFDIFLLVRARHYRSFM